MTISLVEISKEIKNVNAPAIIGEYASFKMAVSFDSFNHKFVMNIKGQFSHKLEIGVDPLGNISHINHALEAMPKELAEAVTKLDNVERHLETAKVEATAICTGSEAFREVRPTFSLKCPAQYGRKRG